VPDTSLGPPRVCAAGPLLPAARPGLVAPGASPTPAELAG